MTNREKVEATFREILELDGPIDWAEIRYQQIKKWDSLGHMAIVAELEDAFEIMIEPEDIIDMSSFEKVLDILTRYGVAD